MDNMKDTMKSQDLVDKYAERDVSIPFLQLKCKISHSKAQEIYNKIQMDKKRRLMLKNSSI